MAASWDRSRVVELRFGCIGGQIGLAVGIVLMVQYRSSLHCRSMCSRSCFVMVWLAVLIGQKRGLLSLQVAGWLDFDSQVGQPVVSFRSLTKLKPTSQGRRPSVIVGFDTAAGLLLLYLHPVAGR